MPQTPTPKPKRGSRASIRRMRLAFLIMIGLTVSVLYTAYNQQEKLQEYTSQLEQLQEQLSTKDNANKEMQLEIERMNDPEYRQEIIRSELNYAKDGETVFEPAKTAK